MKSILISIQPQWVEKILNGEKTIEIRKTMPRCELPCKVYIYCTKGKLYKDNLVVSHSLPVIMPYNANGKVVAEFTLNKITTHKKNFIDLEDNVCYNFKVCDVKNAGFSTDVLCLLDFDEFVENYGQGKPLYAWHIDNLKIYDTPKELSEFRQARKVKAYNFGIWSLEVMPLKKPPQSWCYVKESE